MAQVGGPRIAPRLEQPDGPAMSRQNLTRRVGPRAHLRPPVPAGHGKLDLAEDDVDERGEDLVLVGDVVVDRHRLDAELLREGADRQRRQATCVGHGESALEHALPAQPRTAAIALGIWFSHAPSSVSQAPLAIFVQCTVAFFVLSTTRGRAWTGS